MTNRKPARLVAAAIVACAGLILVLVLGPALAVAAAGDASLRPNQRSEFDVVAVLYLPFALGFGPGGPAGTAPPPHATTPPGETATPTATASPTRRPTATPQPTRTRTPTPRPRPPTATPPGYPGPP